MSYMSQNFRLFHALTLSVLNFRFFLFMYPGSLVAGRRRLKIRPSNQREAHA